MHAHVHAHVFFGGDTGVQRDYLGVSSLGELSFSSCLKISFLHKGYSGPCLQRAFSLPMWNLEECVNGLQLCP